MRRRIVEPAGHERGAYFIAVSRGRLYDKAALVKALDSKKLAGAGLDVTDPEPLPADDSLWNFGNVVITPHLAWYTHEAAARQSHQAADAVLDILAGRRPRNIVNGL